MTFSVDIWLIAALVMPFLGITVAWKRGVFADPYASAWRQMSGVYALRHRRQNALDNVRSLRWIADRFGLDVQLKRAGLQRRPEMYILTCALEGLAVIGATLGVDLLCQAAYLTWPIPLGLGAGVGVLVAVGKFLQLPRMAARRTALLDECMTEIMIPLTIVTADGSMANRKDAIRLFAASLDTPALREFWQPPEAFGKTRAEMNIDYRVLVEDTAARADADLFEEIGERYGIEMFVALAHAENDVDKSRSLFEAFAEVADTYQSRQLTRDEEHADSAKNKVNAVMTLFILIVFGVILVPIAFIVLNSIGGG